MNIMYKGHIMYNAGDFIEDARKLDPEYADALEQFIDLLDAEITDLKEALEMSEERCCDLYTEICEADSI